MNKFIFFQNQANDCMVYPLRRLQSVEGKDDALDFSFESSATGNDVVTVTLSDDSDELLAMQATAQLINKHPHSDGTTYYAEAMSAIDDAIDHTAQ